MDKLGKSMERFRNGGAQFAFWMLIAVIIFLIGFLAFVFNKIDATSITFSFMAILSFSCLAVYMYFKAKTEVDLRENGMFVKNVSKEHEILYSEIARFDKTMRVGKSGHTVIVYYLLVIEKKDGERITLPFRITEDFLVKLVKIGHFSD